MTSVRARIAFASTEPALTGHFPGHPVVPGALLLTDIAAMVEQHWKSPVVRVRLAKFQRPVVADTDYDVQLSQRTDGRIDFRCEGPGGTMATGAFDLRSDP